MYRLKTLAVALALAVCCQSSKAQQNAVTIAFRNELKGVAFAAVIEQLDANGTVVNVTTQQFGPDAIGTTSVIPGTNYNVRILPADGGGFVFTNRDLAGEFTENQSNPIEFEGKFDGSGRRIAVIMHVGKKEISAARMEYPGMDYNSLMAAQKCTAPCLPCERRCYPPCHRWWR